MKFSAAFILAALPALIAADRDHHKSEAPPACGTVISTVTYTYYPTGTGSPSSSSASVSSSSASSSSAPQPTPNYFGIISARSASPVHLQEVNAAGGRFWIGRETASYCPLPAAQCPNNTDETVFAYESGYASLDVEVPGGQQIYVAPEGYLGFTAPHSAYIPPGSSTDDFNYTPGSSFGYFGTTALGATGFLACPNANGTFPYQVFANINGLSDSNVPSGKVSDCLGFDALAPAYTGPNPPVWEYT
ncbi:hypothetical protein L228DRAFT_241922 [Xylona heveae TC161]|uniref:IgE-binding protein n=1 Tax=Xylona heveae (strain CBS 132557 / TC161) TaxID=1328760 RepID=A0A164ZM18_XYLHT|nr:hypothetical protein L228DRAFT_241922 [Xylona heveae TC161]KZF19262.1 hypothetical protein L228DRAFT_241922 [Xylona heveae TC161]